MSTNKSTIEKYIDGFNKSDHAQILSCLTDDVEWVMPGNFHLKGKVEFDGEIENDAFTGRPIVKLMRMIEENNVVIAEGTVQGSFKNGDKLNARFCDVFEMRDALINRLITYLIVLPE